MNRRLCSALIVLALSSVGTALAANPSCPDTICRAAPRTTSPTSTATPIDPLTLGGGTVDSNYGIAIGLDSQAGTPGQVNYNGIPCLGTSPSGAYTNCSQTAVGMMAKATGLASSAFGDGATASGDSSTALGESATASGTQSTAVGNGASATAANSTATGFAGQATAAGATETGALGLASGTDSTATGYESQAVGTNSTALGSWSWAAATDSTAIGNSARATAPGSTAVGSGSVATSGSTALGTASVAAGTTTVAVGDGADAIGNNSVALGAGSAAWRSNTVSVGNAASGLDRQISNVAAGTLTTDAANVGQVQQALTQSETYTNTALVPINDQITALGTAVSQLNNRLDGLGAAEQASAQMAMSCGGSRSCIAAGWGMQGGQSAVALGYRHQIFHGRAAWTVGVSSSNAGTSVGVGFAIRFH